MFLAAVVSSELFTYKGDPTPLSPSLPLLLLTESRTVVLPTILRHIKFHISQRDEAIQRDDSLEKSLEIIGNILVHLHSISPVSIQVIILP